MPFPNEHSCRLRNPDDFKDESFRRTKRKHDGKEYSVIMGRLKGETTLTEQAYRYKKDTWEATDARKHCKDHDGSFEKATGSTFNPWPLTPSEPDPLAKKESGVFGNDVLHAKAPLGRDDDPGFIQGYAAKFDNIDLGGEIMRKGAFKKSLDSGRVRDGKVKLMVRHFAYGGDVLETIGTVTEAKEDDYGLWFNAKLSSVEQAQVARTLVLEGHVNRCSVGYIPVKWNWKSVGDYVDELTDGRMSDFEGLDREMQLLEHTECKFLEVTLTVIPMNELAILTDAKSLDHAASRVRDIGKALETELGVESLSDEQRAGVLESVFGGEAEAKAFRESIANLGGMDELAAKVDRLLHPATHVGTEQSAADREFEMEQKRRRVRLLDAEVVEGG